MAWPNEEKKTTPWSMKDKSVFGFILAENGSFILAEDGGRILQEQVSTQPGYSNKIKNITPYTDKSKS